MYLLTLSFLLKILLMITKEYSKTRPIFRIVSGRILKFISFMNNFKISHMIYTTFPCNTLVKSCIIISWKFVYPPVTQLHCYSNLGETRDSSGLHQPISTVLSTD